MLELTRGGKSFQLRMLSHGAGVYDDDIRIILIRNHFVSHFKKDAAYYFAVCLVLLTAVCIYKSRKALAFIHIADSTDILLLATHKFFRKFFEFHISLPYISAAPVAVAYSECSGIIK